MVNVSFRVSREYDSSGITHVIEPILVHSSKAIVYYHDVSNNPHIHGYVEGYSKTPKWFRDCLKKAFSLTLKTDYSCNFNSDSNFISYMSKGKLDPIFNKGFSVDEIQLYKSKGYDKGTDIVKAPKVHDGPKTKWQMLQDMRDKIAKKEVWRIEDKLEVIIHVLRDNKQVIGEYKVKDYYDTLEMYDNECSFIMRMKKKIEPPDRF